MKYLKFFENFINEGHTQDTIQIENITTDEEAQFFLRNLLQKEKSIDDELAVFNNIWWLGETTDEELTQCSIDNKGEYIAAGKIDGKYYYAYRNK